MTQQEARRRAESIMLCQFGEDAIWPLGLSQQIENALIEAGAVNAALLAAAEKALHCLTEGDRTVYEHEESAYHFLWSAIAAAKG